MNVVILKKGILRAHGMAKEFLASSPFFVLQKGPIKDNLWPQTSLYFLSISLNPSNSFKTEILFHILCEDLPEHSNTWQLHLLPNSSDSRRKKKYIIVIKSWCRPEFQL